MTSIISSLSVNQIRSLSTTTVASLTTEDVQALTTAQIKVLSSSQISALDTDDIAALSTDQLSAITTTGVKGLTLSQMEALDTTQVGSLGTGQLSALSAAQFGALDSEQLDDKERTPDRRPIPDRPGPAGSEQEQAREPPCEPGAEERGVGRVQLRARAQGVHAHDPFGVVCRTNHRSPTTTAMQPVAAEPAAKGMAR